MKAGFLVRSVAGATDFLLGLILGYILHWRLGYYFASRAVVALRIGMPGTVWKGPLPMILGIIGNLFYTLPFALLLILLPEALLGRSIGKMIFGLRITDQNGAAAGPQKLWLRFLLKASLFWGLTLALVLGVWELVVVSFFVGAICIIGFLLSAGPSKLSFYDRLAGTAVWRSR